MTFTGELFIWLMFCALGLLTSVLAYRLAHLVYAAVKGRSRDPDVIDGAAHMRRVQGERVVGWAFLLAIGLATLLQPQPTATVGSASVVGLLIRWTLIGVVGLWSFETGSDYLFARKLWRRNKTR